MSALLFVRDGRTLPFVPVTIAAMQAIREKTAKRRRPYAVATYMALLELANEDRTDRVALAQSEIVDRVGAARSTVQGSLADLQAAGVLEVIERVHGHFRVENEYVVVEPSDEYCTPARETGSGARAADKGCPSDGQQTQEVKEGSPSQREGEENQKGGELLLLDAAEVQRPPRGRAHGGAREGRSMTYEQKRVPDETVEVAERLLGTFNDATGSRLRAWKDSGRPSDHLRQIVGRVMAREGEASEQDWHRAIRNTVAAPPSWMEGPVTIGVIFGERASDHALANTGTVPIRASRGNGGVTAHDFLALRGTLG